MSDQVGNHNVGFLMTRLIYSNSEFGVKAVLYSTVLYSLTHILAWRPIFRTGSNTITPDEMLQNVAFHLGLYSLLTEVSSKNEIKMKNYS